MVYWLDTGVLIQAAKGPYRFKMVPQFWQYMQEQLDAGVIRMARLAYEEIVGNGYDDQLATWCKTRKKMGLCQNETKQVQQRYGQITAHIHEKYAAKHQQVREFLGGADGWVIAYALATNGKLVTQESEHSTKGKIKIPTVAKVFDVSCLNLSQMLEELDADLSGKRE